MLIFSQKMDRLVENFLSSKSGTPELKAEYVKFVTLCRRVGVYDIDLAWEVFYGAVVFCSQFSSLLK